MKQPLFKGLGAPFLLLILLSVLGLYLYYFTDDDVYWGGYISMIFFFSLIFYLGTYIASRHKKEGIDNMILAGRSLPLYIAVFTMSATWVGGGYIKGTAENT